MNRIRNTVIVIVLCIVASASYKARTKSDLGLVPGAEELHDAVAGNSSKSHKILGLPTIADDNLKDAVAEGPAIPTGLHNGIRGNTEDQTPPPPRGGDHSGIGGLGGPNPGSQIPPKNPPPLSPSTPPSQLQD